MKSLNIIQAACRIGKIISKIVYICCIVGFCGCVVGIFAMLIGAETVKLGGVTLHSILETEAGISEGTVIAAISVGMILCIGEYFLARRGYFYFENELRAGTPFTLEGASELLHLGISAIWIPIVSTALAQVAQGVIAAFSENVEALELGELGSIDTGIALIFISVLCRYGAELREGSGEGK